MVGGVLYNRQWDSFIPRSPAWGELGKAWSLPCRLSWGHVALHELSLLTLEHSSREVLVRRVQHFSLADLRFKFQCELYA